MSTNGQGTKCRRNVAKYFNRLSRVHERYRRQIDGRATAYSERERDFTFAKNGWVLEIRSNVIQYATLCFNRG